MKKFYVFFLLFLCSFFSDLHSQAPSCQYDYTWLALGKTGVWPDSTKNFNPGTVATPYTQNITIRVPYDTITSLFGGAPQTFHFDRVELSNPSGFTNYGLPPGLSLSCTPQSCKFPGNDTSCMVIYGIPTTAGTYKLGFKLTTYIVEIPNIAVQNTTILYYKIVISNASGIATFKNTNFTVSQNTPNPVNTNASINYILPAEGKVKLSIYNSIGKLVYEKKENGNNGDNQIEINCKEFASGFYLYSLEYNGLVITKRMIISNN